MAPIAPIAPCMVERLEVSAVAPRVAGGVQLRVGRVDGLEVGEGDCNSRATSHGNGSAGHALPLL